MTSLTKIVQRVGRLQPDDVAIRCGDREKTWGQVVDRVARLASGLQALGLDPGDRVAILSLNSDRYYESIFGVSWAGYCVVPLNTRWALPENLYALGDCGARVLLFDDFFSEQAVQLLEQVDGLEHGIYMGDAQSPAEAQDYEGVIETNTPASPSARDGADMAGIFYTGGTTGFPKGVMQSHGALWASAMGCLTAFEMDRNSTYLHVAPMFHMADFAGSMGSTLLGAKHYVLPAFDPGQVLRTFVDQGITHSLLVPAMIKMLLHHEDAQLAEESLLTRIIYGASPMPAETLKACFERWPSVTFTQAYGQTELAPVATILSAKDHQEGGEKLKSAGRPTPINDIRIVDEDGNDCPRGQSGEIAVTGPHVMMGYWNKPAETEAALVAGWVMTGDAGYFDDEGYLYIVDRVKDMVVTGGENVFTTEVENALIGHPAVQDVAVIGIPHEEWGEAVHAIVVLQAGQEASEAELLDFARERIAGYKLPKSVSFRDDPLPLSGAGKVLKTELRKPFWEGRERQVS